jgi:hypothetical protein
MQPVFTGTTSQLHYTAFSARLLIFSIPLVQVQAENRKRQQAENISSRYRRLQNTFYIRGIAATNKR